ncbi:hypothetical protein ACFCV8_31340 [Streptomyces sp. NPDC056347]|uniref:hypothetical protein n=1 Tax=Streptomyces sp. NPDC056347 TaxID=3345790 RepID=UPI0035E1FDCE
MEQADAGYGQVVYGSTVTVGQEKPGKGFVQGADQPLGGGPETGDLLGYAGVAGRSQTGYPFLVIGVPGEDGAGGVDMGFIHYVYGTDCKAASVSQDTTGVWEDAEPYDRFGASIAATGRHFVVGAPGESLGDAVSAGAVLAFRPSINTNGIPDPLFGMGQSRTSASDLAAEEGDRYGTSVAMVPYRPSGDPAVTNSMLAVGVPGEESAADRADTGGVALFSMLGEPGADDSWIEPGHGIPGPSAPRQLAGMSLGGSQALLYVGMPYGPAEGHAVHGFPWDTANGGAPSETFRPGDGGIPAGDVTFGATVR